MITAIEIYEDVREAFEAAFEALKINTDQQIDMRVTPAQCQELIDSLPKKTDKPMIWNVDSKHLKVIYPLIEVLLQSCAQTLKLAVDFKDTEAKKQTVQLGKRIEFVGVVLATANKGRVQF